VLLSCFIGLSSYLVQVSWAKEQDVKNLSYGADPAQKLDVYRPANPKHAPILLMVHGGAWRIGDKASQSFVQNKVDYWVPKGYIVISINYRMLPVANPLVQANDVAHALAFVQSKASTWGGDASHIVLLGHSAGAHLVSLLAASPGLISKNGAKPWLGTVVLDSAAVDVARLMRLPHMSFYDDAFGNDPNFWQEVSPFAQLKSQPKPMFLVCSTMRRISCIQAKEFQSKVIELKGRAELLPIALSHADINQQLGLADDYTNQIEGFLKSLGLP
jgi:acetyl esterase/lipase